MWHNETTFSSSKNESDPAQLVSKIESLKDSLQAAKNEIRYYRELFEFATDGYLVTDTHWIIQESNRAAEIILNAGQTTLVGKSLSDFLNEDYIFELHDKILTSPYEENIQKIEVRLKPLNGKPFPAALAVCMVRNAGATLAGFRCIIHDVSRLKQMEESVKICKSLYMSFYENSHAIMLQIDPHTSAILDANIAACNFYGFSREEFRNKLLTSVALQPESEVFETIRLAVSEQQTLFFLRHRISTGEERDVEVYAGPFEIQGKTILYSIIHDVTSRKRAEENLRKSEEKFRSLAQTAVDAIISTDFHGKIIFWNTAAENIFGYSQCEALGNSVSMLVAENFRYMFDMAFGGNRLLAGPPLPRQAELAGRRKNGEEFPLELSMGSWQSGEQTFLTCIIRDTTERKKAEEQIRKLSTALEQSPSTVMITDTLGTVEYVNAKFSQLTGYSPEEIIGKKPNVLTAGKIPQIDYHELWETISSGAEWRGEFLNRTKNGDMYWEATTISAIRDGKGNITHYLAIKEDISERKRREREQEATQELVQRTIDEISDPIMVVGTDYQVKFMNRASRDACASEAVPGNRCYEILHNRNVPCSEKNRPCPLVEACVTLRPVIVNHERVSSEGEKRLLEVIAAPILREDGTIMGIIESSRDITDKKQMEEELANARKLEAVGILAGGIAHDFNNFLAAILGNIDLARIYAGQPEKLLERLNLAEKASWRARDLTQQLLTFSKGGSPVKKTASISELVQESALFALRGSNVICEFHLGDDLWAVEIDEGQMSQVIQNLIINAGHAMPDGGIIRLSARNMVLDEDTMLNGIMTPAGNYVLLSVEDEGTGISPVILPRIFDPYFTTKAKGTGLGLTTTYSIVKNHGGVIMVDSEQGKGTSFHIYLPASDIKYLNKADVIEVAPLGKGKILVMDDDEMLRDLSCELLTILGYETSAVSDGFQAVNEYMTAMLDERPYDAIIMDLTIPGGMGGKEAVKQLLAVDPQCIAIAASGYSNDPVMSDYEDYGFKGIIVKPFKYIELSRVLHKVLSAARNASAEEAEVR